MKRQLFRVNTINIGKYLVICSFLAAAFVALVLPTVAQVTYSGVAFAEEGLPSGTQWSVICNGTLYQSTTSTISIFLPPGTYNFSVSDISGYGVTPKSGNVTAFLDPIRLTTVTFSPLIPEFDSNLAAFGSLMCLTSLVAFFLTKQKKDGLRWILSADETAAFL